MATDRSPIAYLWPTLKAFATGDVITRELLRDSINKAGDIGYGVLAALNERFQQLGSTNAGTSAVQRGTVVMGTLSFYDPVDVPVGALDGKTLILGTDLDDPVTITFGQPTSPVHAATEINTQGASMGLVASADTGVDPNTGTVVAANVGKLLLVRPSGATASLKVYGAGTANAILGLPLVDTTVTGAGTVNDGASRMGLGAITATIPWAGGTLRAFLVAQYALVNASASALATKVAKAGDTMTGSLTFTSPAKVVYNAAFSRPSRGKWSIASVNTQWEYYASSPTVAIQMSVVGGITFVDHDLDLIPGDELDGVDVWSWSDGVAHANLPAIMPTIRIYKWPSNASTPTALGGSAVTDPSGSAATYDAIHAVSITGLAETVATNTRYFVRYTGEDGANEDAGRALLNVIVNGTSKGLPPGL